MRRQWDPDNRALACGRALLPGYVKSGRGRYIGWRQGAWAHFPYTQTCKDPWQCLTCALRLTAQRSREASAAMARWRAQRGSIAMATFTIPHTPTTPLKASLDAYSAAMEAMTHSSAYKTLMRNLDRAHRLRAIDVMLSRRGGWNNHGHEFWFLGDHATHDRLPDEKWPLAEEDIQAELSALWCHYLKATGIPIPNEKAFAQHGVRLQLGYRSDAAYVAKHGRARHRPWDALDRLCNVPSRTRKRGASFNPLYLPLMAAEGEVHKGWARERWLEYVAATKGRQQLKWSPGAREALGIPVPRPGVATESESQETGGFWLYDAEDSAVRHAGMDGLLLDSAVSGATGGVLITLTLARPYLPPSEQERLEEPEPGRYRFKPSEPTGPATRPVYAGMQGGP